MKILSVHEGVVPISSSIRNAWIDFTAMDCSIVAIVSDVVRGGEPVVGYGFNSNGRYSAGEILRRRILPRLLDAEGVGTLLEEIVGTADAELGRVEYRTTLAPLLDRLPERECTILKLRFFAGLTQSEIAQQIGLSQMHVSRLLSRTLARLREQLRSES